jgi:hypothetical protein
VTIISSVVVAGGGYAVMAAGDSSTWTYPFTPDFFFGGKPDFNNGGGDFAYIYYTGSTATIDFDTTANYSAVGASAGYSVQLSAADLSDTASSDVSNWCASSTDIGSTGDYGTPGAANSVCR